MSYADASSRYALHGLANHELLQSAAARIPLVFAELAAWKLTVLEHVVDLMRLLADNLSDVFETPDDVFAKFIVAQDGFNSWCHGFNS